jgi:hypothetical protein
MERNLKAFVCNFVVSCASTFGSLQFIHLYPVRCYELLKFDSFHQLYQLQRIFGPKRWSDRRLEKTA